MPVTNGAKIGIHRVAAAVAWSLLALRGWYQLTQDRTPRPVEGLWIVASVAWLIAASWSRSAYDAEEERKRLGKATNADPTRT